MKTTIDYLDKIKEKHKLSSDYKLAKYLGLTTTAIGYYRKKKSTMDDYTALKVAEALGIDPMEVIAMANAERTKSPEVKKAWERIATRTAHAAMLILLVFSTFPTPGQAETRNAKKTLYTLCEVKVCLAKAPIAATKIIQRPK